VALLLHEPLDAPTLIERRFVVAEIERHAANVPVVCTTARPELTSELSRAALWLEAGRLRRATSPTTAPALRPGVAPTLVVTCNDAAKLARALTPHEAVGELRLLRCRSTVEVRGEKLDALCLAVCRAADEAGVAVHQIAQVFPELSEVRAVHAAIARTAYERAYGALHQRPNGERR
jgi:hypothetical protein